MSQLKIYYSVFLEVLKRHGWLYSIYFFNLLIICSKEFFLIFSVAEILDTLENNGDIFQSNLVILLTLYILSFLMNFLNNIIYNDLDKKLESEIWLSINHKIAQLKWMTFENKELYDDIEHVSVNSSQSYRNIAFGIPNYLIIFIKILVYLFLSIQLGILFAGALIFMLLLGLFIKLRLGKSTEDMYDRLIPIKKYIRYLTVFPIHPVKNAEFVSKRMNDLFTNKIDNAFKKAEQLESRIMLRERGLALIMGIYWGIVFFVIVFYITSYSSNISVISAFSTTILSFYFLFVNLEGFGKSINDDVMNIIDVRKMNHFLKLPQDDLKLPLMSEIYSITLKEVCFTYPNMDSSSLINVNINIEAGDKIMVVGLNGSGKTTLCTILSGINKDYEGVMTFNGDATDAKVVDFIDRVAYMTQEFGQYNLTLKENIFLGNKINEEEYYKVLKSSKFFDIIGDIDDDRPLGVLDEEASNLSKGEWQRVALARMLTKMSSDVFILDEPTSHLDPIAEIDFYHQINEITKDKIVFFVSHRLGYALYTSKIIFIEQGQVIAFDTHANLMKNNEKYRAMYHEQRKWYE